MSGKPAARVGDAHTCPMVDPGPMPHLGGPVLPPGAPTVLIGGKPAARMGDTVACAGLATDSIQGGAFPVSIERNPAARMSDKTAHGGVIVTGEPTVLIGLAGVAGNVLVGTAFCQAAASGRASGATQQSYNNCGVESSRQIINRATGSNLTEEGLLRSSIDQQLAVGGPGQPLAFADGGTNALTRQAILANSGVPSTVMATNPENLGLALSRGQGVIASLDASKLWGPPTPPGSLHAITVTGIEYDDAGNRVAVMINDTGSGQCGQRVPARQFDEAAAAHTHSQLNVTTNPIF